VRLVVGGGGWRYGEIEAAQLWPTRCGGAGHDCCGSQRRRNIIGVESPLSSFRYWGSDWRDARASRLPVRGGGVGSRVVHEDEDDSAAPDLALLW
jgi:hypothetical protein